MDILFLHPRFPAQFLHLAHGLADNPENRVIFLAQTRRVDIDCPLVRVVKVPFTRPPKDMKGADTALLANFYTAEIYASAMLNLAKEGFYPDLIYDHPGWGCGMYARDIFPNAARICYGEWFYTKSADYAFFNHGEPRPPAAFATNRQRNFYLLDALTDCDMVITPTLWQQSQFPVEFLYKFRVLFDGIDTDFFSPGPETDAKVQGLDLASLPEIVTYATRGMDPYRGFPVFFNSIPRLHELRPQAHVVIMANDEVTYGAPRRDGKTWGEVMREKVEYDPARVHFLHFDKYPAYRKLLRASSVHAYLSAPFVPSWSLLEAMSCGCLVIGSDTPPVREFIRHTENGFLTSFWDADSLASMIAHVLENRQMYGGIRRQARSLMEERYSLAKLYPQHLLAIKDAVLRKKLMLRAEQDMHTPPPDDNLFHGQPYA